MEYVGLSEVREVLAVAEGASTFVSDCVLSDARRVVVKALRARADRASAARFAREFAVLRSVQHPNVVRTLTHEDAFDGAFVMPRLVGVTLRGWLDRVGPMPRDVAVHVARGMLAGLGALHGAGVVHRDIKPANVFFGREEGEPAGSARAIVLDLGVARREGRPLTAEGMLIGTPRYLAPEQLTGKGVDPRADLFAVGLVLFELLTGAAFFGRELSRRAEMPTLDARLRGLSRAAQRQVRPFEVSLRRALAEDPRARFASAREMWLAIDGGAEASR